MQKTYQHRQMQFPLACPGVNSGCAPRSLSFRPPVLSLHSNSNQLNGPFQFVAGKIYMRERAARFQSSPVEHTK